MLPAGAAAFSAVAATFVAGALMLSAGAAKLSAAGLVIDLVVKLKWQKESVRQAS